MGISTMPRKASGEGRCFFFKSLQIHCFFFHFPGEMKNSSLWQSHHDRKILRYSRRIYSSKRSDISRIEFFLYPSTVQKMHFLQFYQFCCLTTKALFSWKRNKIFVVVWLNVIKRREKISKQKKSPSVCSLTFLAHCKVRIAKYDFWFTLVTAGTWGYATL